MRRSAIDGELESRWDGVAAARRLRGVPPAPGRARQRAHRGPLRARLQLPICAARMFDPDISRLRTGLARRDNFSNEQDWISIAIDPVGTRRVRSSSISIPTASSGTVSRTRTPAPPPPPPTSRSKSRHASTPIAGSSSCASPSRSCVMPRARRKLARAGAPQLPARGTARDGGAGDSGECALLHVSRRADPSAR